MLYRLTYPRGSITFSAADLIAAEEFREMWEQTVQQICELQPLGASKFPAKAYTRTYARRPQQGLTKDEQFQLEISAS